MRLPARSKVLAFLVLSALTAPAQPVVLGQAAQKKVLASAPAAAKRAISHEVYDGWKSIQSPKVSEDGIWLAYAAPTSGRRRRDRGAEPRHRDRTPAPARQGRAGHARRPVPRVHGRAAQGGRRQGEEGEEEARGTAQERVGRHRPRLGPAVDHRACEERAPAEAVERVRGVPPRGAGEEGRREEGRAGEEGGRSREARGRREEEEGKEEGARDRPRHPRAGHGCRDGRR